MRSQRLHMSSPEGRAAGPNDRHMRLDQRELQVHGLVEDRLGSPKRRLGLADGQRQEDGARQIRVAMASVVTRTG